MLQKVKCKRERDPELMPTARAGGGRESWAARLGSLILLGHIGVGDGATSAH